MPAAGPPSFPVNGILDNFNRADEGPPPSANWSSSIVSGHNGMKVAGNQAVSSGSSSSAYWNTSLGPDVEVYVAFGDQDDRQCVWARVINEGTVNASGYQLLLNKATGFLQLYRVDNGSGTQLGANFTQTIAVGDSFGMSIVGSTITVYFKPSAGSWSSLGTRSDGTYTSAGKIGMQSVDAANTTGWMDNFGGGSL